MDIAQALSYLIGLALMPLMYVILHSIVAFIIKEIMIIIGALYSIVKFMFHIPNS